MIHDLQLIEKINKAIIGTILNMRKFIDCSRCPCKCSMSSEVDCVHSWYEYLMKGDK